MNLGYQAIVRATASPATPECAETLLRYTIRNIALVTDSARIVEHWNAACGLTDRLSRLSAVVRRCRQHRHARGGSRSCCRRGRSRWPPQPWGTDTVPFETVSVTARPRQRPGPGGDIDQVAVSDVVRAASRIDHRFRRRRLGTRCRSSAEPAARAGHRRIGRAASCSASLPGEVPRRTEGAPAPSRTRGRIREVTPAAYGVDVDTGTRGIRVSVASSSGSRPARGAGGRGVRPARAPTFRDGRGAAVRPRRCTASRRRRRDQGTGRRALELVGAAERGWRLGGLGRRRVGASRTSSCLNAGGAAWHRAAVADWRR